MTRAPRERWALAAVLVGFLLVSIVPLVAHGALGIARNDDWDFSRSLFASVQAGRLVVDPWTSAMLWGHLLWAWPLVEVLGESRAALQVATIAIGTLALLTLHGLLRRWTPAWVATTTVAVTALGPLYPLLAGSYMTDVPAFALQLVALAAGVRALAGHRVVWGWWVLGLVAALAAFTVREYAVAVLVGLLAGMLARGPSRRELAWTAVSLGVWAATAGALMWLRVSSTRPLWAGEVDAAGGPPLESLVVAGRGLATLSLLVVPALPWVMALIVAAPRTRRSRVVAALAVVGSAAAVAVWFRRDPFVPIHPSYLSNKPAYWNQLDGQAPGWMPLPAWLLVGLLSLLSLGALSVLLVGWTVGWRARPAASPDDAMVALDQRVARATCVGFLVGGAVVVVGLNAVRGFPAFDRYFVPIAPFLLALVLSVQVHGLLLRRAAAASVMAVTVAWAGWGLLAADVAATNDGLRWSVGRELTDQGWRPSTVDAGYEWWGAHQGTPTTAGPPRPGATSWAAMFPGTPVCVQASYASPGRTPEGILLTRSARTLTGTEIVVVARVVDPSCARPTPSVGP